MPLFVFEKQTIRLYFHIGIFFLSCMIKDGIVLLVQLPYFLYLELMGYLLLAHEIT
jgi:hypothetical protein